MEPTTDTAAHAARTEPWLDRFFLALYAADPVSATFIGVHDRDHLLPDYSEDGAGAALAEMRALLAACPDAERDARTALERIDLRLARGHLEIRIREYESAHFHRGNPAVYTSEAVFGVLSLFLTDFAPIGERVEAAVERLRAVPELLAQGRANVRSAPVAWTERALRECTGALAFLGEGIDLLAASERIPGRALRDAANTAAAAFRAYRDHLASGLLGRPHDRYGCGEEMLALCMRAGHHIETAPDELARWAESELEAAEARLQAGARALGGTGPAESLARLADAHPPAERYYQRYGEEWASVRAAVEANALLTWPDSPIRYVPRPPWSRAAAPYLYFLFYRSPAAYGRPPVHDYLVTPIEPDMPADERTRLLRENNDAVIRLNHVIHHGGIGHHVQNWHAFRSPSRIGRIAAVDCASRIALLCGGTMAEGWACYATDLMGEIGFLTPLEQLAELRSRTRMCARALVDVRLHQRRLTLEDAAALYETRAGMSHAAASAEAVKNSMHPGAALMYLAGRDAIHTLRKELSARAGAGFDLRTFHDRFLSFGSIPVSLIAQAMTRESSQR
jgi:uncharacterized protein (DUF885 family)